MRKEQLVNFQNIIPGQVAILTCPIGPTYERLKINLTNGLLTSHIISIEGKINEKTFFTTTGDDLLKDNLYEGRANPTTLVLLDFLRENAKSSAGLHGPTAQSAEIMSTAICSSLMQKLTFEFKLSPTAPAGSNMVAYAQLNNPSKNPLVLKQLYSSPAFPIPQDNDYPLAVGAAGSIIKKLYLHQANYTAAWTASTVYAVGAQVANGNNLYQCTTAGTSAASPATGPSGIGAGIADGTAVWAYVSGYGQIAKIQVRNSGVIIWEGTPADAVSDQTDYGKVQQPGLTVIDFDLQGMREKWLNTAVTQNVFIRLTTQYGPLPLRLYQSIVDPVQRV